MVDNNVKVALRVRPMNQREIDLEAECIVHMEGKQTVLKTTSPTYEGSCTEQKEFLFDHCFWSVNDEGPTEYTSQEDIFETLGKDLIDSIFAGFNSCIFVYGQTGSGKTFSMMGSDDQPGLVPRICSALFSQDISHIKSLQVEAAYLEIYNEKVRDLLYPTRDFKALKVREHKSLGPYVDGLSQHTVRNQKDIKSLIDEGNKCRKIASTKMNEQSSRSHAIFTLTVTQTLQKERGAMKELLSKVSLVDLAGSERTSTSGATGDRMKESNNINKSLTSLGLVINSLAELSQGRRKSSYVNYRDSKLTWLLKNNLGGNSKTVMLATISPASVHYQETLSTLKYADSAKRIVNNATVNEDIKSKAIDELKDEVRSLREQLQQSEEKYKKKLEAKLNESEKLLQELKFSWEEKLKKTETSALERQKHLQKLGITVEDIGIRVAEEKCYLFNSSSGISHHKELILYNLGEITKIGAGDSQDIQIIRPGIELEHCVIDIKQDGEFYLTPNKNAETFVNGSRVQTVVMLSHEDKINIGNEASFTLHKPNTKLNTTHEWANASDSATSNQDKERNRQGNESNDEECDSSVSSDNIQWSYRENIDGSVSKCPYSNASCSIDSSGHGFLDISQNKSIASAEIRDTKHLEDQDSCDRNITPIDTIISPKNHKEHINLDIFKSYNKKTIKDDSTDIQIQISEDDKTDICIKLTENVENISGKNKTSTEDGDRTDPSVSQSAQSKMEHNVSSENEISKIGDDDNTDISINPTSQTEMEDNESGEKQISTEDDDRTNISIHPTSQTFMEQILRSQSQKSKDLKINLSINPSSQTVMEQNIRSENKNEISTEDDARTDTSISQSAWREKKQYFCEKEIYKDGDDKSNETINPTTQTVLDQNISGENQICNEDDDRTNIPINPTSQTVLDQNISGEYQICNGGDERTNISINPTSQTETEENLSIGNQISTESDDRINISINTISQTLLDQTISSEFQICNEGDGTTNNSINPTSQTKIYHSSSSMKEISKEGGDNTNISINPTSQTVPEKNISNENQISKKGDDRTDPSINQSAQSKMEDNVSREDEKSKEGDENSSEISTNPTSQTEMEENVSSENKISTEDDDRTDPSINPSTQSEIKHVSENKISRDGDGKSNETINPTSQTVLDQNISGEKQIYNEGDDRTNIPINSISQSGREENISNENQISKKGDDRTDPSINQSAQSKMEDNVSSENEKSKEGDENSSEISTNPTSQTEMEENVSSENPISTEDDDRINISINTISQPGMEQTLWSHSQVFKDDKSNFSVKPTSPSAELSNQEITRSGNNLKNSETGEEHPGLSTGSASSEEATSYIRRSRREIMAILQKDFDDWMDDLDSQNIITQEEYFTLEKMSDTKDKARKLVNIILQKNELSCRSFLQRLKLNPEEEDLPDQEAKKSHIVESEKVNTDKDEKICEPDENLQEEIQTKDEEIREPDENLQEEIQRKEEENLPDQEGKKSHIVESNRVNTDKDEEIREPDENLQEEIQTKEEENLPEQEAKKSHIVESEKVITDKDEEIREPDENLQEEIQTKEEENLPEQEEKKSHIVESEKVITDKEEENLPEQEAKKSHIVESEKVNTDKDEEICEPDENLQEEIQTKDRRTCFQDLLEKMEFQRYQTSKLTLREVLDIGEECLMPGGSPMENEAWYFIRKLMSLHMEARNISTIGNRREMSREDGFMLDEDSDLSGGIHPLDLQCAIFHCSDHFLQQEMISKMSMCQFSVPLLLPASDGPDCTLMLWAMRGIVKKWRPQSLAESKGYLEEHLVKIFMPTFSFVRLGNCRLSKSKILNQILSSTQNYQDIFIHRDMEGGNMERTISSGLVEISWYFPAGKGFFAEPVAFTNLRGELENNLKPFSFLAEISSIVVVFAETISKNECDLLLTNKNSKTTYLFIIAPEKQKSKKEIEEMRESVMSMMEIKKDNVLVITRTTNEATTVNKIRSALVKLEKENTYCLSVEGMSQIAKQQKISVDEHVAECQAAERKAKAITEEIRDVVVYKGRTMKLQAQLLKDLSRLEKELCQMKKQENKNGEKYKSDLKIQCDKIRRKQWECEMPKGVFHFINGIETQNRSEKFYFLSWLKYYLDLAARKTLTFLHEKYKEKYQARDSKELTEIDQKLSDSSLGIEHFVREVSQFYEVWHFMGKKKTKHTESSSLPEKAAGLLLNGYPLELIDGDSSRIHVQWVTEVLNGVNFKTGGRSRIRVITVLGVQSTGKSTLLNTMFGLQFPVASGRCTRGAFMTLIKVKENLQKDLRCEYLLVIDTEGLKAPELGSLEGSYEHDNELATLVVGLSDITVINLAMENITEMKDILQIVIHAFLRMKEIGKKPNCQFVHQNVSDVSAYDKNMRDRNKLLEQLNEMTKTVAEMEKKPQYKVFSDIMEYDAEQHHWYIPSLWQGVPPMAPVSAGYSEHVAELKQNLLKLIKQNQNQAQTIPQFVRWIGDLWNAVKHENFIFSFRNSLVASAYNKLSMKYSELEWKFKKQIHEWFINTETIIKNQSEDTLEAKGKECCMKLENIISAEQSKILTWVEEYFEQEKDCVHLIRYKEDFIVSAKMLGENLRRSSYDKYNNAIHIQKQQHKIKGVRKQYIEKIKRKVSSLMEDCRKRRHQMDATKMGEEFENMWKDTVKELEVKPLETRDVEKEMMLELTKTMRDKGSAVYEKLNKIKQFPKPENKHEGGGITGFLKKLFSRSNKNEYISQYILNKCCKYSAEQARRDCDYDDTYCRQLLIMIDDILREEENIPAEQELEIKLVILGHTVTDFQEMHNNFIKKNDPHSQLEALKSVYLNTFMNVFRKKNESRDLAKRIYDTCLKPAMIDYFHRKLGIELVDDIMRSEGSETYTSRTFFQYTVLLNLLEGNDFRKYVEYSRNYEEFVKNWILEYIIVKYKNDDIVQSKILSGITEKIRDQLNNPEMWKDTKNVKDFLHHFQKKLNSDLVFPQEKMEAIILGNSADTKEFIQNLKNFLTDTKEEIIAEMKSLCVQDILTRVTVKPQDELFKKIFGCGKQCPFCAVPCEAGGENHKEHFASVHRPKGLGTYRFTDSSILCHDLCTTSVCGDGSFRNHDTKQARHPYKKYREIYPDWRIQPDLSIEASDYWKFVLKEFNGRFAEEYKAKPADYPKEWDSLTKDMAKESLKKTFNM